MVAGVVIGRLIPSAIAGVRGIEFGKGSQINAPICRPESNFSELAVAADIALFGPETDAALATVIGVSVEVPVMLSVRAACNRTSHWFPTPMRGSA
jgi:ACR3 family arsenite efflux pump ArsB